MSDITKQLRIVGHDCFEPRDPNERPSFSVMAAYKLGEPAVKLYIDEETAKELRAATSNGFKRDETRGVEFKEYNAEAEFTLRTVSKVNRGDNPRKDRVNHQLGLRLEDLQAVA